MSAWRRVSVVFWKEVTDNLRDRRSLFSALLSSLIGPVLMLVLIVLLGQTLYVSARENPLTLAVSGADRAPQLMLFLEQNGVDLRLLASDPETAVRNGVYEVVLVIPKGYQEAFSKGLPAPVQLVIDSSRQSASVSVNRARTLVNAYNLQIGNMRLLARGISPTVTQPLAIQQIDMATPESKAGFFLNMMPYFIVLVVFLGGMYVIIDTTAGERERGSLEPLLINPVARWEFVVGKLMAAIPFAVLTILITLVAFAIAFNFFPLETYIGIHIRLSLRVLAEIFLISIPMIVLASALQMIIATFTRSFKEAQTYVAFLPLIPAIPGIGLALLPIKAALWMMLIPTFGQQLIINKLMVGEPISLYYALVSAASTLVISLGLVFIAVKLYEQERVLFGPQ
jgi:sodium transport system permease protein